MKCPHCEKEFEPSIKDFFSIRGLGIWQYYFSYCKICAKKYYLESQLTFKCGFLAFILTALASPLLFVILYTMGINLFFAAVLTGAVTIPIEQFFTFLLERGKFVPTAQKPESISLFNKKRIIGNLVGVTLVLLCLILTIFFITPEGNIAGWFMASKIPGQWATRALISMGAGVNTKSYQDFRPLHILLSMNPRKDLIQLLISNKADVNAPDAYWGPPIFSALDKEKAACLELLLKNGAEVNCQDSLMGWSPLQHAVLQEDNGAIIKLLLKAGARINAQGKNGATPLHMAVSKGRKENVKMLLKNGASAKISNNKGKTPLDKAKEKGFKEIEKILLSSLR
ncbi:ankyrin repeat domain-containing protein [Candidatus Riflebacteria bacterium]